MIRTTTIKALIASLLLIAPAAQAVVLTFDDIGASHGTVIGSQYSGVTISATNTGGGPSGNTAVAFNSAINPGLTSDDDLVNPDGAPSNLGNILIIQENSAGCGTGTCSNPDDEGSRPAGYFTFDFTGVIELLSIDFIDIESAENGSTSPNNAILLYDDTDTLITFGTSNTDADPYPFHTPFTGNNKWGQLNQTTFDSALFPELKNIGRIDVYMGGSGAIDNLSYNVVPVPAAFWLFGTALIGFIGFSRRTAV